MCSISWENRIKAIPRILRSMIRRTHTGMGAFWRIMVGNEYSYRSYSQYGEDMVLRAIYARYPANYPGFYVDIGAHHPFRFSTTRFFYETGWNGICVDPLPLAAKLFKRYRPRDIFLQVGVSEKAGEMTYLMLDEPAFNRLSEQIALENIERVRQTQEVKVLPLHQILGRYRFPGSEFDFLSVDVEGSELQVLRSNNWEYYRPRIVLVEEMSSLRLNEVADTERSRFMKRVDY